MFRKRLNILYLVILGLTLLMVGRMAQLQLFQGADYAASSADALRRKELTHTCRGRILDRNGCELAVDRPSLDVCVDYRALVRDERWMKWTARRQWRLRHPGEPVEADQAIEELGGRLDRMYERLSALAGHTPQELTDAIEAIRTRVETIKRLVEASHGTDVTIAEETSPQALIEDVPREAADRIAAEMADMPWLSIDSSARKRFYPYGDVAPHVIGYTGGLPAEGEVDFDRYFVRRTDGGRERIRLRDPRTDERLDGYVPWDQVGRTGIERICQDRLRGSRGLILSHIDARAPDGRVIDRVIESVPGRDVRLTIDIELQREVERLLDGVELGMGAAVVIDVPTGEILALASAPRFDLNRYRDQLAELSTDWRGPMIHRAAGGLYPPGSTAKPVTAMAALQAGVITTQSTYTCRGYLYQPNQFRCHLKWGHGPVNVYEALEQSCNVFFYHAAEEVGSPLMQEWQDWFGFGRQVAWDVPGQNSGIVPFPEVVRRRRPDQPSIRAGDLRNMGIGQGDLAVTPLQVANMMVILARSGAHIPPEMILGDSQPDRPPPSTPRMNQLKLDPAAVDAVREGLRRVVNGDKGTGRTTVRMEDMEVAGKTGTAETEPLRQDGRPIAVCLQDDGDTKCHAWFAGFAPYRQPQIALAVLVEYGGHGGVAAGPVAKQIFELCRKRGYLGVGRLVAAG